MVCAVPSGQLHLQPDHHGEGRERDGGPWRSESEAPPGDRRMLGGERSEHTPEGHGRTSWGGGATENTPRGEERHQRRPLHQELRQS